jgi:hypothetical protein
MPLCCNATPNGGDYRSAALQGRYTPIQLEKTHLVSPRDEVVLAYGELLAVLKAGVAPPVDHAQLKRLVPAAAAAAATLCESGGA